MISLVHSFGKVCDCVCH